MQVSRGERVRVKTAGQGRPERVGEVVEVLGENGAPPYWVRFDDGHEALVAPRLEFDGPQRDSPHRGWDV
ncbi:DUF1918 domain-containing protein [Pendulispora brunnea]|uniref:DUF1918 domain-containing protein n=1 Tax=Pendulispora brunnea TaxID=2905690 RepID=A0ABZ2JYJ1_9BACT